MSEQKKTCWIITGGDVGTENQARGLAEALGLEPVIKRLKLKFPWRQLSPWLGWHSSALASDSDRIEPPYPDILIASGRKSIGAALHIKRQSGNKTFLVQVQDPRYNPKHFDLVVALQHDPTRGDNVITTTAAMHRVTPEKIDAEKKKFAAVLEALPEPRVAVLIGGSSKVHQMTPYVAGRLGGMLHALDASLMITCSRRTGAENEKMLRATLAGPRTYFWDGTGDNPYFALLGFADYIIVTEDSVSMTSEAISTGKPVYIAALEGGSPRHNRFHKLLQEQGYTRPFTGQLESWLYTPPRDTLKAADEVRRKLDMKE